MKRTLLAAAFIVTALSVGIPGQTSEQKSGKDEKAQNEVIALAEQYFKASVETDAAAMERILSDDYTRIQSYDSVGFDISTGLPIDKQLLVRFFKEDQRNGLRLASIEMEDEIFRTVRFFGDTAVLVTKITLNWKGSREELAKKYKHMPKNDEFIITLVAVKKNGAWQVASSHQSEFRLVSRLSPNPNQRD